MAGYSSAGVRDTATPSVGVAAPQTMPGLAGRYEQVAGGPVARVVAHELGQRDLEVDAEDGLDLSQDRVVLEVEPVAVAQGFELLLPDGPLQLTELGTGDVLLRHQADERVDVVDRPVDGLEASG